MPKKKKKNIGELFDEISLAFMMVEPGEKETIAAFHKKINSLIIESAKTKVSDEFSTKLSLLCKVVEYMLDNPGGDNTDNFVEITRLLSALQNSLVRGETQGNNQQKQNDSEKEIDLEDDITVSATTPFVLPENVDEKIFGDFIARQDSVLETLENNILQIEKGNAAEAIPELRRIIHTLKGETGVLGLECVEKVCHKCEGYIDKNCEKLSIDLLLIVKDWLSGTFAKYNGGDVAVASCESIIEKLSFAGKQQNIAAGDSDIKAGSALEHDESILADFIFEANEHLDACEHKMLVLEEDPKNSEALNHVFRCFHTIKGLAGFLNLGEIGKCAHETENLLDKARKHDITLSSEDIDTIFAAIDLIRQLIGKLTCDKDSREKDEEAEAYIDQKQQVDKKAALEKDESNKNTAMLQAHTIQTVKIDTTRLDKLVDMIGEMAIAATMICHDPELIAGSSSRICRNLTHMEKITRELQDMGMSMRMVPIRSTFQKMARLVRDLAKESDKQINFCMTGEDTELDRSVVELIGDPLIHLIRNAVDHGIESAEERKRSGKIATGHVGLKAFHKGGNIYIEIRDDGKGLDRDAILNKAKQTGLVDNGAVLTDQEIYNLIFHPGFSTAKKITNVSGRGVGMDVVKRSVEALRGQIEIHTEKGKGTTFSMHLPLTLAIIDGLVVAVGGERYIIPTLSVLHTFRPRPEEISTVVGRGEMFSWREKLIPLFRLSKLFRVGDARLDPANALIIVVEDGLRQLGILVDRLLGKQQTVIKNLGGALHGLPGISGGAIMADGQVGLIIDVNGLIKIAYSEKAEYIDNLVYAEAN